MKMASKRTATIRGVISLIGVGVILFGRSVLLLSVDVVFEVSYAQAMPSESVYFLLPENHDVGIPGYFFSTMCACRPPCPAMIMDCL